MIIDVHNHPDYYGYHPAKFLSNMDEFGIDYTCLLSWEAPVNDYDPGYKNSECPFTDVPTPFERCVAYRDRAPDRYFAFAERPEEEDADPEPYRTVRSLLEQTGFAAVDGLVDFVGGPGLPSAFFPYGGTHWTVALAAHAAARALERAAPSLPRPAPDRFALAPGPDDPRDRDLAL